MKPNKTPWLVFLVGLFLRLIPVLLTRGLGIGLDDMFQYDMLARSLASGNGYRWYARDDLRMLEAYVHFDLSGVDYDPVRGVPTSFRAPLYPAFLALVYLLTGGGTGRFFAARLVQAVLGALLAPLTYAVSRRLFPDREPVAVMSAWVVACYPILLLYPLGLATENLFFLLVLVSFLFLLLLAEASLQQRPLLLPLWLSQCLTILNAKVANLRLMPINPRQFVKFVHLRYLRSKAANLSNDLEKTILLPPNHELRLENDVSRFTPHVSRLTLYALLSGLFLSLAALTRSVILPFAGLTVLWAWFVLRQRRAAVVMALTMLVVLAPWVVRNSLLHHKLTGIESSLGYNLYVGYHPESDGSFTFGVSLDLIPILDDAERDRIGTQRALAFIRAQPGRFLPLALDRLGFFFGLEKRVLMYFYSNNLLGYLPPPILLTAAAILLLPFVVVAPSAALGLGLMPMNPRTLLLSLLLLAYLLPHAFILAEDRFHLALIPYLAILAAQALRPGSGQAWTGGLPALAARWREGWKGKIALALAVVVVLLLFTNWGLELARDADKIAALLGPNGNHARFPY
jgi:hypothetical protein